MAADDKANSLHFYEKFFLRLQNIIIIKFSKTQNQVRSNRISMSAEETIEMLLSNMAEPRTGPILHFTFLLQ